VRQSLNIRNHSKPWKQCSHHYKYVKQYTTIKPQLQELINSDKSLEPFYIMETFDNVCNFLVVAYFANKLGLTKDVPYQSWAFGTGIGGFHSHFKGAAGGELTFTTVGSRTYGAT